MRITVLGTCAGFAGRNRGCSAYLLSLEDRHYLIDAGPGAVACVQNFIPLHRLSGILLSHLHADHVSDLFTLRFALHTALKQGDLPAPIPLYLPRTPERTAAFVEGSLGGELRPSFIDQGRVIELAGAEIRFLKTEHPAECYAMRIEWDDRCAVYTADTALFEELADFARGAGLLISEATLQEADRGLESMGHMTARSAGVLAREAGAGMLLLTHIWPLYDRALSAAQARETFAGTLLVAERGQVHTPRRAKPEQGASLY